MKTRLNATLEEFSSDRFNVIRKMEARIWDEMKPFFKTIPEESIDEMNVEAQQYIDEKVKNLITNFKSRKDRLEFVLDYLWLHFFTRNVDEILTKDYSPPAHEYMKAFDFDPASDELTYPNVFKFLNETGHWMAKPAKVAEEIMKRRGIWESAAYNYFPYFKSRDKMEKNLERDATHFVGIFPLPEYQVMIPDKPMGRTPRSIMIPKAPNKTLANGSPRPNLTPFKFDDFDWGRFTFAVLNVAREDSGLIDFEALKELEQIVQDKIKAQGDAAEEIEPTPEMEAIWERSGAPKGVLRKGKTLIEFADGSKWIIIEGRTFCELEGRSVGHCGNNYRKNDQRLRVMSFRVPSETTPGKFVGYLTFIYNKESKMIGEAKGRGNSKPGSRFHPYIKALMLLDCVEGMEQGSHNTANDFSLNDLSIEDLKDLIEKKPTLFAKSKVGRSSILNNNLTEEWAASYKKATGEPAPKLEDLKFDRNPKSGSKSKSRR